MVGVAGRSKGCHTCRKRKIKCDRSIPTCKQCARGSWVCEGYERAVVFRNQYSTTYLSGSINRQLRHIATQNRSATKSSYTYNEVTPSNVGVAADTAGFCPSGLRSLTRVVNMALYDQIMSSFITLCLPTRASEEVPLAWLFSLYQGTLRSETLSLAAAGVGYGWMGHEDRCLDALQRGRQLYCSALSSAQQLVNSPKHTEGLLPTIMMLLLYELFEFGTQTSLGWQSHANGIETILQLNGPWTFSYALDFEMFYFYRTIGILRSLTARKSTFLSREEWIDVPWALGTKNFYHQFLDLATEVPGLLEQVDSISARGIRDSSTETIRKGIFHRIAHLIHRMRAWETSKSPPLAYGPPHTFCPSGTSMIATDRLHVRTHRYPSKNPCATGAVFDQLQSARLMLFNWAVMLTLYICIHDDLHLSASLENGYLSSTLVSNSIDLSEAEILADKISLWADFCCQNAWQSFGPAIGIFSVNVAIQWYQVRLNAQLPITSEEYIQHQLQRCQTLLAHLSYCDHNTAFL